MFEFSVAKKYLIPRRKQLSVSIIALISILVISLVVWLVLLFLSITDGMERNWIEKLIALNAPLQATPTEAYYQSYFYQIDSVSADSNYRFKSLKEKLESAESDPYDPGFDPEPPEYWPPADRNSSNELRDPVKGLVEATTSISSIPGLKATPFEMAYSQLRVRLLRNHGNNASFHTQMTQKIQSSLLALNSFTGNSERLQNTLLPPSSKDLSNLLFLLSVSSKNIQEDTPLEDQSIALSEFQKQLEHFLPYVQIESLITPDDDWSLPLHLLPETGNSSLEVCVLSLGSGEVWKVLIPKNKDELGSLIKEYEAKGSIPFKDTLKVQDRSLSLTSGKQCRENQLFLSKDSEMVASLIEKTVPNAHQASELRFSIQDQLQNVPIKGVIPYGTLNLGKATAQTKFSSMPKSPPLWCYSIESNEGTPIAFLPGDSVVGEGILLSYRFQENGLLTGDRGFLSYNSAGASGLQEQRIPVYVAGFYDTGIIAIGNKMVLASPSITTLVRSSVEQHQQGDAGFQIWMKDYKQAEQVKKQLISRLEEKGIDRYWKIETYKEYEFSKDLVRQFQSDKNLLTLIAVIIILIACSNIISMLVILVNDKKKEIGILLSMGASSKSIALIFGMCGLTLGVAGSVLGITAASLTLRNIDFLVNLITRIQGYDAFNSSFYGNLSSQLSSEALIFVIVATLIISLLAGIIPAIKASLLRPSVILRSE